MEQFTTIFLSIMVFGIPFFYKTYFSSPKNANDVVVSKRDYFFDFLKGLSIVCVILIHVGFFYNQYFENNNLRFLFFVNNLARFAIPIFFICSGILLNPIILNKKSLWDFYKKKLFRIFLPYFFVMTVIAIASNYSILDFFEKLITGRALAPFYFVIVLLQLYILYPFICQIRKKKELLYLSFFISLFSFLFPAFWSFYGVTLCLQYLFFFVYGVYKRNDYLAYDKTAHRKDLILWFSIVFVYLLFSLIFPELYYNIRLFYGVAVFNILFYFKNVLEKFTVTCKILASFGQNSLWIFYLHFYIVYSFYYFFNKLTPNYYLNFFFIFLISTPISFICGYVCSYLYNKLLKHL